MLHPDAVQDPFDAGQVDDMYLQFSNCYAKRPFIMKRGRILTHWLALEFMYDFCEIHWNRANCIPGVWDWSPSRLRIGDCGDSLKTKNIVAIKWSDCDADYEVEIFETFGSNSKKQMLRIGNEEEFVLLNKNLDSICGKWTVVFVPINMQCGQNNHKAIDM